MVSVYPAFFYKNEDGSYTVIFPDLDGTTTQGDDLQDAMDMAMECMAGYVYDEKTQGNELPEASDISSLDPVGYLKEVDPDLDAGECFVTYVSVDVEGYAREHFEKTVKKTVTIPYRLNKLGMERNINFSKVLKEALEKILL